MSEISRLFAKAPNSHSQTDLAEVLKFIVSNGYKRNDGSDLEVTEASPAAMSVVVGDGKAWIEGYYYFNNADYTLSIDPADAVLNRIDRIVLECDYLTDLEITAKVVKGTAAAVPVAPSLTRAGGIYEISLAQVYVGAGVVAIYNSNITDERDDATLCGVAQGLEVAKVGQLHSLTLPRLNGSTTVAGRPSETSHYALAQTGNDLYFFGGNAGTYDSSTKYSGDVWTALTDITTPRRYGARASYYDGKIYVIGGQDAAAALLDDNEEYTISTDAWAAKTVKTTPSSGHMQVQLNGKIYCFGGKTAAAAAGDTILEIYDIAGNTWSSGTALPSTPSISGIDNEGTAATDGTNIYLSYNVGGGVTAFIRYNVASDSYTSLTEPQTAGASDTWGHLYYHQGAFYAWAGSRFMHYNIDTDTWTAVNTNPALTNDGTTPTAMLDNGIVIDALKHYTYYYYLGTAAAEYILGFRTRSDADLGLYNHDTLTAGVETICTTVGDRYGIYVNDITMTDTDYEVEVYG